jgi:hypothetical protein
VVKGRDKIEKGIAQLMTSRLKMAVECTELAYLHEDYFLGAGKYTFATPDGATARGNFGCTMVKHRGEWAMGLHVANLTPAA